MTDTVKITIPFLTTGGTVAAWLSSDSAHGAINTVIGQAPPQDIADVIQHWAVVLTICLAVVGALATKAITGWFEMRRLWRDQQDKFDDETKKTTQIQAVQEVHHQQIAQLNAAQPEPLGTIQPPGETVASSGIRPITP